MFRKTVVHKLVSLRSAALGFLVMLSFIVSFDISVFVDIAAFRIFTLFGALVLANNYKSSFLSPVTAALMRYLVSRYICFSTMLACDSLSLFLNRLTAGALCAHFGLRRIIFSFEQ
jgi:hypothetical protein